jgi:hypothetical protein
MFNKGYAALTVLSMPVAYERFDAVDWGFGYMGWGVKAKLENGK